MADFKIAYELTARAEGGYSNNPNDAGGETWKGVARKKHPRWTGWKIVDDVKSKIGVPTVEIIEAALKKNTELQKHVYAFYKELFWNINRLDDVNDQRIANEVYDTGVNCGTGVAALFLQRALNVTNRNQKDYPNLLLDGNIGPKTIAVLNNHRRPGDVLKVLNILQGNKYIEICEARESQEEFMSGWLTRVSL